MRKAKIRYTYKLIEAEESKKNKDLKVVEKYKNNIKQYNDEIKKLEQQNQS